MSAQLPVKLRRQLCTVDIGNRIKAAILELK